MNTSETPSEYLLLFRGNAWDRDLSPAEKQTSMTAFTSWFERLNSEGILKSGRPLKEEGRVVSGLGGRTVADGPFAESKEAVGGYFIVKATGFDQATAIAQQCPVLQHGVVVEVRPIASECPTFKRIDESLAVTV